MKSLRFIICVLMSGLLLTGCDKMNPDNQKTIRILAIGNSFSADAVEQNLWELFHAEGINVEIGNMIVADYLCKDNFILPKNTYDKVVGGKMTAAKEMSIDAILADGEWDYISFQEVSHDSGVYDRYLKNLPDMIAYVKARSQAEIVFHQTWAYPAYSTEAGFATYGNDQMAMYQGIMDATKKFVQENGITKVIPSGTAIQNARSSYLGDTFNRDGLHLELSYGRYTAACAWFETLSGKMVVGNTYYPSGVSFKVALLCQTAAHTACQHPYQVTSMSDFR